jgi:hypothetical protein
VDVKPDRDRAAAMTIGQLSRCTGAPVKVLRQYEDLGFIYTAGAAPGTTASSATRHSGASRSCRCSEGWG